MSYSRYRRLSAAVVVGAIVLAGCGGSDALTGKVVEDGLGCEISQVDRTTESPTITKVEKAPTKIETKDLVKGKAKACVADSENYLTLDLVGATAMDAKVFTDTREDGRPITAKLRTGQLLAGLETGLDGMKVGGRRQITLPAKDAYGKEGNMAQGIGPNEPLEFVVDLVGVTSSVEYCAAANAIPSEVDGKKLEGKPTTDQIEMPVEAPVDEVDTKDLKVGTGETVGKDRYVTVDYVGVSCLTGTQFDSSWDSGEPITVALGKAEQTDTAFAVIPGWSDGLATAKVGSLRQLNIPYALAYGDAGRPPTIGQKEPLVFVIEVLDVSDKAPPSTTTTTAATSTTAPADGSTTTTAAP